MTVTYRNGLPRDAAAVAEFARLTFVETFGTLYHPDDLQAFLARHTVDAYEDELADPNFALRFAEENRCFAAFAKLGPPSLPVETRENALELRQLYVRRQWQGHGVAHALMDWIIAEARRRGADELWLSVFTDNHRARRFYENYGFRFVAPYAFMVGDHADEDHILRLDLRVPA